MRESIPLILLGSIFEVYGSMNLKKYALDESRWDALVMSLGSYSAMIYVILQVFKKDKLCVSNYIWNGFSTILGTGAGLYMGETLTLEEQIGGLLQISSIGILSTQKASTY